MAAKAKLREWPVTAEDGQPLALWTLAEVAAATGGQAFGEAQISNVATDSREIVEGGLFFAMRGEAMDGHKFLDKAFELGAVAAVVEQPIDRPHVLVKDSFAALQALARAARERILPEARVIGVTGSVGKTSVKEAIFAALERSSHGRAHRSVKSYNNHVGVPLSMTRMPQRTLYGIFEMGMNHAGEIRELTALARPHVAVITTIAPAISKIWAARRRLPTPRPRFLKACKGLRIMRAGSPSSLPIFPITNACAPPPSPAGRR